MRRLGQLLRLFYINYIMARHGIDRVVFSVPLLSPLRFLSYLNPWNWFAKKVKTRGERVRLILTDLGPIFVKFGQLLSTRRDLLPDDITDELSKLQDQVPPYPGEQAKAIIEHTYGKKIDELFKQFDLVPLASASIAQVHAATLKDGRKVVVKVLRPNIDKVIRHDIGLMYTVAKLTKRLWSQSQRLRPVEVVAEFERTIRKELDLTREAANASQLRRNFLHSETLYVPEIYWEYARKNVMVMERIKGIPIADIERLKKQKVNLKVLAEEGVEIFFTQVFRDSFFHADMHPGNLFVDATNPDKPGYIAVDFGIMGSLSPFDQRYIAENLLAFFKRDYRRVAILHVESGWLPADTRIDEFEFAIRAVCESIFEKPLKEISFGQLLVRLFQTAAQFQVHLQPQLLLLQKTMLNVEGMGRQLYPDLNLWATAKPFLEKWLRETYGPKALLKKVIEKTPSWSEKITNIPDLLYDFLQTRPPLHPLPKQAPEKPATSNFWLGLGIAFIIAAGLNVGLLRHNVYDMLIWNMAILSAGLIALLASAIKR